MKKFLALSMTFGATLLLMTGCGTAQADEHEYAGEYDTNQTVATSRVQQELEEGYEFFEDLRTMLIAQDPEHIADVQILAGDGYELIVELTFTESAEVDLSLLETAAATLEIGMRGFASMLQAELESDYFVVTIRYVDAADTVLFDASFTAE